MNKRGRIYWIITIFVFITLLLFALFYKTEKPLKIIMLNIGQGDAIYIETPGGQNLLVDSGKDKRILSELSNVMPFGKNTINTVEISNPDLDHMGGVPFVLEKYNVKQVLSPGTYRNDSSVYKKIQEMVINQKINTIRPKSGDKIILDKQNNVTYTILWPEGNVRNWETNPSSIVGLVEYSGHKILLTGDAPKEVEDILVSKYEKLLKNIDILKVGHHGSRTSTGSALATLAHPKYSIISAGKDNSYGHPHKEALYNLQKVNSKILVTKDVGRITCYIYKSKDTVCNHN